MNDELTERLERPQKELRAEPSSRQLVDADIDHNRSALDLMARADNQQITFKDFRMLMEQRNQGVDDLADRFRGKIDNPREFFERVMSCRVKVAGRFEDRSLRDPVPERDRVLPRGASKTWRKAINVIALAVAARRSLDSSSLPAPAAEKEFKDKKRPRTCDYRRPGS